MTIVIITSLIVAGFILLAVEFFLVPGFSVPGIAGITMIGYGIFRSSIEYGSSGALITVSISAVVAVILVRAALKSRIAGKVALDYSQKGITAIKDYSGLMDKTGVALSNLRPSGTAHIDGKNYDVVTDGEFIEENTEIVVTEIDGTRIVVTHIERR